MLASIVTPLVMGIAQFATAKEKLWESMSPIVSSYLATNRFVPLAVVAVIVRHAAAREKPRLAVKAANLHGYRLESEDAGREEQTPREPFLETGRCFKGLKSIVTSSAFACPRAASRPREQNSEQRLGSDSR